MKKQDVYYVGEFKEWREEKGEGRRECILEW